MPRVRYHQSIELAPSPKVTRLRSTPRDVDSKGTPAPPMLRAAIVPQNTRQDLDRTRYGRALNLDRIEIALRAADYGSMQQLTDLSRETVDVDPHLAAVLNKRFGAVSALPWEVQPVTGYGIDQMKARFYADVVTDQLKQLPNFGQRIHQLAWGLYDGRAALENVWLAPQQVDGLPQVVHNEYGVVTWMIRDLEWVHPRRIQFGPRRELRINDRSFGSFSNAGLELDSLPMKFVQFMPQLFGDYQEREGLARRCLYWSFFKRVSARERLQLMELFGKPWRWLEVDEDSTADADDLTSADAQLQQLGGLASFRFPRGTKLNVQQPAKGAGEVHQQIIEESDKQLSKLVLGQTGTTDANPAGLNNAQANVMQDEQFMILMRDARLIGEALETHLTDAIVELNFGPQAVTHAPHFVLRADVPLDRTKEIARLDAAIKSGLEVALSEAYELSGFRAPKEDEAVIKLDTPPLHPLAVQPPPERPVVHYPTGANLPKRTQQPIAPSAGGGLKSPEPVASPQSPAAERLPATEATGQPATATAATEPLARRQERALRACGLFELANTIRQLADAVEDRVSSESNSGVTAIVGPAVALALSKAHPSDAAVMRTVYSIALEVGDETPSREGAGTFGEDILTAPQPVDREELGSIEALITRGTARAARASTKMVDEFVSAVVGKTNARAISAALEKVAESQNLHEFSRSMERTLMFGAMSGALSSHFEVSGGVQLPIDLAASKAFTERSFNEAVQWFKRLGVLTRTEFEQLEASVRRRAFTIAGIHNKMQLDVAKRELTRLLQAGHSILNFDQALRERFVSNGMTALKPSHVENVYRTNTVNAYNSGRHIQTTQPSVMRTHGYWQIRTVSDNRRRDSHGAVEGWVLKANDPVWKRAYPPFGFNCRCRVVSVPNELVEGGKMRVRSGSEIANLPDPGFTSGTSTLL